MRRFMRGDVAYLLGIPVPERLCREIGTTALPRSDPTAAVK